MITSRAGKLVQCGGAFLKPRAVLSPDVIFASHGDSISRDRGLENYIYQLRTLYQSDTGNRAAVSQRGINGISWDYRWPSEPIDTTLILDAPATVDPVRSDTIPSWLIAWAGTNGMTIAGHTAAQEYADLVTYVQARLVAGWDAEKIVIPTMLPRSGFSETVRGDYNAAIVADAENLGYIVARLDLDDDIGGAGDEANATYFYDGVHLTDAGHARVAAILYAAMFP